MTRALADGVQTLTEAIAAGEVKHMDDPARFTSAVWAALHGVTSLTISRRLRLGRTDMPATELMGVATDLSDELVSDLLAAQLSHGGRGHR